MSKQTKTLMAVAIVNALLLTSTFSMAAEGTFKASAQGHNGPVDVTMTVTKDGKIASVTVGPNKETVGIADSALRIIPDQIVKHQSLGIDALTGATFSSKAVLAAARDCAKQASLDGSHQ